MRFFPSIAALAAFPVVGVEEGEVAYVESLRDQFVLRQEPTAEADGIAIVAANDGLQERRLWQRLNVAHPSWRMQTAWFISTAGSDENGGLTSLTPLKTDQELARRWGVRPVLTVPTTVTYAQTPTGITNYNVGCSDTGSLRLVGTNTVTKAGTVITAVQAQVRTAGAEAGHAITGVGLGADDVGKLVFITAGTAANIGAYAAVLKDESGGKIRVSPFSKVDDTTGVLTQVTAVAGDTVEVRVPSTLNVGSIEVFSAGVANPATAGFSRVVFDALTLDGGATTNGAISTHKLAVYYVRSVLSRISWCGTSSANSAHLVRGGLIGTGGLTVRGPGTNTLTNPGVLGAVVVPAGGLLTVSVDTYFQNCGLSTSRGGVISTQGAAFFDRSAADSTLVASAGSTIFHASATADWGTNNAGHGLCVFSAGSYVYAVKPTINSGLGAGREARVGGTDKLWSAIPFVEPANNAVLVANA